MADGKMIMDGCEDIFEFIIVEFRCIALVELIRIPFLKNEVYGVRRFVLAANHHIIL